MEDSRHYIVEDRAYWDSPRAQFLFGVTPEELIAADQHPQGLIREMPDKVLGLKKDLKGFIEGEATKAVAADLMPEFAEAFIAGPNEELAKDVQLGAEGPA